MNTLVSNNELKEQFLVLVRFIFVFGFAALYAFGGIDNLWLRRFLAPVELSIGMFIFSRDWRVFIQAPVMMLTLSVGYGADETWLKVLRRSIWGALNGCSSSVYIIFSAVGNSHLWVLVYFQVTLMFLTSVILGAFNPLANARAEEFFIGTIIAFIPMMSVRRKF